MTMDARHVIHACVKIHHFRLFNQSPVRARWVSIEPTKIFSLSRSSILSPALLRIDLSLDVSHAVGLYIIGLSLTGCGIGDIACLTNEDLTSMTASRYELQLKRLNPDKSVDLYSYAAPDRIDDQHFAEAEPVSRVNCLLNCFFKIHWVKILIMLLI